MQNNETDEPIEVENVNQTALTQHIKAEIDMQIATAKAYPRSLAQFRKRILSIATINEDVAASCTYSLPRKEKQNDGSYKTKIIQGPSIRLAEIVSNSYGNIRTGARVIDNNGREITAQGVCHDLETNSVATFEHIRRITDKFGRVFSADMQSLTANAACAIAYRNAIFKVIPLALISDIYEDIQLVAIGTGETLIKRRAKAISYFTDKKITEQQICDILDIKGYDDIDLEKLAVLSGMKSAVHNGEALLVDLFAPKDEKSEGDKAKAAKTIDATKNLIEKKKRR